MNKIKKLMLVLVMSLFCCTMLTGCGNFSLNPAKWFSNTVDDSMEQGFKDAKKAVKESSKEIKKQNKKLSRTVIHKGEKGYTWKRIQAFFGHKYITEDAHNQAQADLEQAEKEYNSNQNTLNVMTKVNSSRPFVRAFTLIGLLVILVGLLIYCTVKKRQKQPAPAPVPAPEPAPAPVMQESPPALTDVQRSGRLKADYPAALAKDCEVLGLDYDNVLNDFNGNAEAAYETIHVQALKKQYK